MIKLFKAALLALAGLPLAAQSYNLRIMGYDDAVIERLRLGERVNSLGDSFDSISLAPKAFLRQALMDDIAALKPKTVIEALYFLPETAGAAPLDVYNNLLEVSKLSGLEFYSRSEKKTKLLIEEAYAVAGPKSRERIDDPHAESLPAEQIVYFWQNDETFGKKYYAAHYKTAPNGEIALQVENLEKLNQGIINTASVSGMRIVLWGLPMPQGTLFYGLVANSKGTPGFLKDKMNASMLNRLDAFKNWTLGRYPQSAGKGEDRPAGESGKEK